MLICTVCIKCTNGLSRIRGPISVSSFIIRPLHCRPLILFLRTRHLSRWSAPCAFDPRDRSTRASEEGRASIAFRIVFLIFTSASRGRKEGNSFFRTTLRPPLRSAARNLSGSAVSPIFSLVCCERAGPSLVDHGVCVLCTGRRVAASPGGNTVYKYH